MSVALIETVAEAIAEDRRVEFRGFGAFRISERDPRRARNPLTGDEVWVERRYSVRFKPGLKLKKAVNGAAHGSG